MNCTTSADCYDGTQQSCDSDPNSIYNKTCSCFSLDGNADPDPLLVDGCTTITAGSIIIILIIVVLMVVQGYALKVSIDSYKKLERKKRFTVVGFCLISSILANVFQLLFHLF